MQKRSALTQKQLEEILEKYVFGESKLNEIIENKIGSNCNLNLGAIIHRISQIVRNFVLELEKSIWLVHKIKQLKIYDHESDQLFEKITLNLQSIIREDSRADFMHLHKNITLNFIEIIWQTQYIFVHSDKKMEIYQSIIDFCQKNDLFAKAHQLQVDPLQKKLPFQSVEELFPIRDLELILKKFRESKGHVLKTYQELKKLQMNSAEYKTQREFVSRFDNLLLIGVYKIHKLASHQQGRQCDSWQTFKMRGFGRVSFEPYLDILLKMAIRNDAQAEQIREVIRILRKKCFRSNIKKAGYLFPKGKGQSEMQDNQVNHFSIEEVTPKHDYPWGGNDRARLYYDED